MPNAIMVASSNGHTELVTLLLKHGATAVELENMQDDIIHLTGFSALTFASQGYHWDIAMSLISNGYDINKVNCSDYVTYIYHPSPIMYACEQGNIDVVKDLLQLAADINAAVWHSTVNDPCYSPLISATTHGHIDVVQFILAYEGFKAFETVPYALVEACKRKHIDIAEVLRSHVKELNEFHHSESGCAATPLSIVSKRGTLESVKLLLDIGADINAPVDRNGGTALLGACESGSMKVSQFLLERGAKAGAVNNRGETALFSMCYNRRPQTFKYLLTLLIEHGADINKATFDGETVLMRYLTRY